MNRKNDIDIVEALKEFSALDEQAARILSEYNLPYQSIYSSLQAMEKLLKAELARRINLANQGLADVTRVHNLQELADMLVEIVASRDQGLREQMRGQLNNIIQVNHPYDRFLPNNARYPQLDIRNGKYFQMEMSNADAIMVLDRISQLKKYLYGLHRL